MKITHEDDDKIVLAERSVLSSSETVPTWQQLKDGEINNDFELQLLFRRTAMKECYLMLCRFVKVMKDDRKEKIEFQAHADNLLLLIKLEEVLDKELRTSRQRACDLELALLRALNDKNEVEVRQGEINASEEEFERMEKRIEELEKENADLKQKNEELIKMI